MKETLLAGLKRLEIDLPEERTEAIVRFGQAVLEKNQVMNLTAITEPEQAAELHLLDSLSRFTTEAEVGQLVDAVREAAERLR